MTASTVLPTVNRILKASRLRWERSLEKAEHRTTQPQLLDLRLIPAALLVWSITLAWITEGNSMALLVLVALALLAGLLVLARCRTLNTGGVRGKVSAGQGFSQALTQALLLALMICLLQSLNIMHKGLSDQWQLFDDLNGQGVRVSGVVADSHPAPAGGYLTRLTLENLTHRHQTHQVSATLRIYTSELATPGTPVQGVGNLQVAGTYYRLKGGLTASGQATESTTIFDLKTATREQTTNAIGADRSGLLLGMAYGDDSTLNTETLTAMRTAGLTHLTAVSGANISLIFILTYRLIYPHLTHRRLVLLLALGAAGLYVVLVGPDGSVLRAWTMGVCAALGMILGHGNYRMTMLSTCILTLLFLQPPLAADYGFILSVTATASLLVLAPAFSRILSRKIPLILADLITMPLAASLWCLPVILILSQGIYPYTVLANALAAPWVAPITLLGLVVLAATALGAPDPLVSLTSQLGALATEPLLGIAHWVHQLPGSQIPLPVTPASVLITLAIVGTFTALTLIFDRKINEPVPPRLPQQLSHHQGRP